MGEQGGKTKGKTRQEERQGWECRRHRSRRGQAAAAPEPRAPAGSSGSSSAASCSPGPALGSQLSHCPVALDPGKGRGGAEPGHTGAFQSKGRMEVRGTPRPGSPWAGSTRGHGGGLRHGLSSPSRALHGSSHSNTTSTQPPSIPSAPLSAEPEAVPTSQGCTRNISPQPCWPLSPPSCGLKTPAMPCNPPLTWLGWSLRAADGGDAAEGWPALLHLGGRRDARERSAAPAVTSTAPSLPPLIPRPHLTDSPDRLPPAANKWWLHARPSSGTGQPPAGLTWGGGEELHPLPAAPWAFDPERCSVFSLRAPA